MRTFFPKHYLLAEFWRCLVGGRFSAASVGQQPSDEKYFAFRYHFVYCCLYFEKIENFFQKQQQRELQRLSFLQKENRRVFLCSHFVNIFVDWMLLFVLHPAWNKEDRTIRNYSYWKSPKYFSSDVKNIENFFLSGEVLKKDNFYRFWNRCQVWLIYLIVFCNYKR